MVRLGCRIFKVARRILTLGFGSLYTNGNRKGYGDLEFIAPTGSKLRRTRGISASRKAIRNNRLHVNQGGKAITERLSHHFLKRDIPLGNTWTAPTPHNGLLFAEQVPVGQGSLVPNQIQYLEAILATPQSRGPVTVEIIIALPLFPGPR